MMNEADKKKVFWLLKKYSSYTAWKALGDAFQKFTDDWEYAVRHSAEPLDADDMWVEALKGFWVGCEGFDKGLPLLKRGERSVFRYNAHGYLGWHAIYAIEYANKLMDTTEYVHDWMVNKEQAFIHWHEMYSSIGGTFSVKERTKSPGNATFGQGTIFDPLFGPFNIPANLSEAPPASDIVVNTGEPVPYSGIWEPEWATENGKPSGGFLKGLLSLAGGTSTQFEQGCMNYLLADTLAPNYRDQELLPAMPVRWRLIWEDTRYLDGKIPDEEAEYLAKPVSSEVSALLHPVRCEANQPCPKSGYWWSPAERNSRRYFKQNEAMPEFVASSYGATIWYWDTHSQNT